jgi:arsenite-transporting ATPase
MFGGKGGVGKTTLSAATALHLARSGRRTLIISSDLAPSLSDIFETDVGPTETAIEAVDQLYGLEIDTDEVMRRWKEKFGPQIYEAASALVDMPYDEIVDYVAMAPGIQEEFMLDFILERVQNDHYDVIVWDTAPAGETLHLLGLPERFIEHLQTAPRVYLRLRDTLNLSRAPFLDIIEEWKALAQRVTDFFTAPDHVAFLLVTIPEALGFYQTQRVLGELERYGLSPRHLIINHVIQEANCDFLRRRQEMQRPYVEQYHDQYAARMHILELPLLADEVKGVERLKAFENLLFEDKRRLNQSTTT